MMAESTTATVSMKQHALAILGEGSKLSNWPVTKRIQESGKPSSKFETITPSFLYHLIKESFGNEVPDQFWKQLGSCDEKLKENIERLKDEDFVSASESFKVLFRGLNHEEVNFDPVLKMAAEFFTHLGVAFMNPGGPKSGASTTFSVSEIVDRETDELLQHVKDSDKKYGKRCQEHLKELAFRRDGTFCLLTGRRFLFHKAVGMSPVLAHIIPNSVHGKPDTLKCIAMFAGAAAAHDVANYLNSIGNVMNMQLDAHVSYDSLDWGIEAEAEGGEVKYIFRVLSTDVYERAPLFTLREGDEIQFGRGPEGQKLSNGPNPRLCNLQLAVARVLKMSAAADIISEWKYQADDDGSCPFIAPEEFCDIVDAKLFLLGGALVA